MSTFGDRQQARSNVVIDILPPVEGSAKVVRLHRRRPEVVDASFVPVDGASAAHQSGLHPIATERTAKAGIQLHIPTRLGLEAYRLAAGIERKLLRLSAEAFRAVVAAASVVVFVLAGGLSLIQDDVQPIETGPVLDITHVTMTPQDANGMRVLLINGIVENRGAGSLAMPAIIAELISNERVLASTLITTAASTIRGRESYGFSARVPHPGGKLPDLRLSFSGRGV